MNSLVYELKAVWPIEVEISSLRIFMEAEIEKTEWVQTRGQKPYAMSNVTKKGWFVPMIRRTNREISEKVIWC